jgi:hypothetical protein
MTKALRGQIQAPAWRGGDRCRTHALTTSKSALVITQLNTQSSPIFHTRTGAVSLAAVLSPPFSFYASF